MLRLNGVPLFCLFFTVACGEDSALRYGASEQGGSTVGARAPEEYRNYENTEVDRSRRGVPGQIFSTSDTGQGFEPVASFEDDPEGDPDLLSDTGSLPNSVSSSVSSSVSNSVSNSVSSPVEGPLSVELDSGSHALGELNSLDAPNPATMDAPVKPAELLPVTATAGAPVKPAELLPVTLIETVSDVVDVCQSAAKKTRTVQVVFEEKNQTCKFGNGGNLSKVDGKVRARAETYVALEISEHELLCDVSLSSAEQSLKFDDEIFLTFNDIILLSSHNYNSRFDLSAPDHDTPSYFYNWSNLVGSFNPGYTRADNGYCLGQGQADAFCKIPKTEHLGSFGLQVGTRESALLSLSALENKSARVGFIVTGDNDNSDCKHSRIVIDVQMSSVSL